MDAHGHAPIQTVGFIGLGRMGWPMAMNLRRAGYELVVRDADRDVERRFTEESGAVSGRDATAFANARAVVTMLPDGRVVQDALLRDGVADVLSAGAVVVDMSSSSPHDTRDLGGELGRRSIALVDAPVSGGVARASDGSLAIMAGADDEASLDRVLPMLNVLGRRVFRTGPLASGHAMKALNNFCAAAAYAALAEALVLGRGFGLEPSTMVEIVNNSTGRSFCSDVVFPNEVLTGRYNTGFALGLLAKDVTIAAGIAEGSGVAAPLCELVRRRWEGAAQSLGFAADHSLAHKDWWDVDLSEVRSGSS
ncbi:MAG TPA: NAD(P)-dependent oxidoreductase [Solirubrobacteraceae bacterium]|nr:NAD(P)-dependent oxidoreductase [Solirubrobacteraceae bacterium]